MSHVLPKQHSLHRPARNGKLGNIQALHFVPAMGIQLKTFAGFRKPLLEKFREDAFARHARAEIGIIVQAVTCTRFLAAMLCKTSISRSINADLVMSPTG